MSMYPGYDRDPDQNNLDPNNPFRNISGISGPFNEDSNDKGMYSFEKELLGEGVEVPQEFKAIFGDGKQGGDNKNFSNNPMLYPSKVNGARFLQENYMENNIVPMQNPFSMLNPSMTNKQVINPMQTSPNDYNPMAQYNQQGIQLNFNQLNTSSGNVRQGTGVNDSNNKSLNMSNSKDLSTSGISKSRSKNNSKNKNYQVQINDDIVLIERIEGVLNQITNNHNRVCPYSSRIIDIKKCNFQNISAFFSNTSKKYYLTYFDSYLKQNANPSGAKIINLVDITEAKMNPNLTNLVTIDTSQYLRSDRKTYFISIEGYHSISTNLLFKLEKICHGLEHGTNRNQLIFLNLSQKTTSIFEPSQYMIPYNEFRMVITIYSTHSSEDPYVFEYLVDFSQTKVSNEQKSKYAEAIFLEGNNNIIFGTQIIFDPNNEVSNSLNYKISLDTSFSAGGSSPSVKPDFGKNVFMALKHLTVALPLKRVEKKTKEPGSMVSIDENASKTTSSSQQGQKKPHSKLTLNPNAPLFSNSSGGNQANNSNTQGNNTQYNKPPIQQTQQQTNTQQTTNQGFNNKNLTINTQLNSNIQANPSSNFQQNTQQQQPQQQNQQNMQQQYFFQTQNNPNTFQEQTYSNFNTFNQNQGNQQQNFFNLQQGGGFFQGGMQDFNTKQTVKPQQQQTNQTFQPFLQQQDPFFNNKQQVSSNDANYMPPGLENILSQSSFYSNTNTSTSSGQISKPQPQYVQTQQKQQQQQFPQTVIGERQNSFQREPSNKEGTFSDVIGLIDENTDRDGSPSLNYNINTNIEEFVLEQNKKKKGNNSLYEKALKKTDGANSPGLISRIQEDYFSGVSSPQSNMSADSFHTGTPRASEKGSLIFEDNPPITDDMVDNFRLEEYKGKIVEFAKTYNGSRVLQKFFPRAQQNEIDLVIKEIEEYVDDLMLDPYANYMFQTLAQICTADQRLLLLQKIAPKMIQIACDKKGTHSLQAIVSLISRDVEDRLIIETLRDHVLELSYDPQGTHLIQKLINSISPNSIGFIYNPIVERFVEVANHSSGLCVLKQLMNKVEKLPECKKTILGLLYENLENLIQNPYGNYAIQHALETYAKDCNPILDKILDKIIQYSNQKYSSNVIEKCIITASPEYKKKYLSEVIKPDRLLELMKNKYGNFVILKMLSVIEVEDKQLLMNALYKCLQHLTIVKYRTRWITFINENPLKIPNIPSAQGIQTFKPSLFKNQNPQIGEEQNPYIRGQNTEYYGNVIQNTNEMYAGGGNEWDQEPIQNLQQNYNIPQQQQHLNLNMQNQYQQYYYNQGNQNQNQMMNLQQQNQQQNINNQYGGFFNPNMQNQQQQAYMQQQPQYQQQMLQQQYQQQMQQQKQQQQQQQYSNYKKQQPVPKQGMNSKWHNDKDHHGKGFDRFDN